MGGRGGGGGDTLGFRPGRHHIPGQLARSGIRRALNRRFVLGSLGAAAYRPDVIRSAGKVVDSVIRKLVG